jgi:hypothetical protein
MGRKSSLRHTFSIKCVQMEAKASFFCLLFAGLNPL